MPSEQTRKEVAEWLEAWYSVGDQCVPSNSVKWFTQDITVRFNNAAPIQGKSTVQEHFESIITTFEWMKTESLEFDIVDENKIYNECNVSYILRHDPERKKITMHRMNYFERVPKGKPDEGKISRWTGYFDTSPIHERMAEIKLDKKFY